jgi:hypothetical protein
VVRCPFLSAIFRRRCEDDISEVRKSRKFRNKKEKSTVQSNASYFRQQKLLPAVTWGEQVREKGKLLKDEGRKWKHEKQRDNKKVIISFALVAHDENTVKSAK